MKDRVIKNNNFKHQGKINVSGLAKNRFVDYKGKVDNRKFIKPNYKYYPNNKYTHNRGKKYTKYWKDFSFKRSKQKWNKANNFKNDPTLRIKSGRLLPGQLKKLNQKKKIRWWNHKYFGVDNLGLDLYGAVRRSLIRKSVGTAISPSFPLAYSGTSKFIFEGRGFEFFGRRLDVYVFLKRKRVCRKRFYKSYLKKTLDLARKSLVIGYASRYIRKSIFYYSLLKGILFLQRFKLLVLKRRSKLLKYLKHNAIEKMYTMHFNPLIFFKKNKRVFRKGFSVNLLTNYFLNSLSSKLHYNIIRHPFLYIFRRECKKYHYFFRQLERDVQSQLLDSIHVKIPIFVIKPTLNNLIVYIYNKKQLIFSLSSGMTLRSKDESRQTNFAKFNLLHAACNKLNQLGIRLVDLKIINGSRRYMRKFYKTFFRKRTIKVRNILFAARNAHNGLRIRKMRRI